jgi:Tol biopolymer transport system component/tRNA A-37 threonylcarbamoyl transferase component Bud32
MTPERWSVVEELFERSLELPDIERAALLNDACAGDCELRYEVESLVDAHKRSRGYRPGRGTIRPIVDALEAEYYVGCTLGAYKLVGLIGRGGSGSVYRAAEILTNREVAIKILSPELFASPAARLLMERRCREAIAFRHRHVASVYALEQTGTADFIVMEFVDGATLEQRARVTALPVWIFLRVAWQLAAALRATHRAGAAHGDVRPANVMIDPAGQVRLVDWATSEAHVATDWKQYRSLLAWMFPRRLAWACAALVLLVSMAAWRSSPAYPPRGPTQLTYDPHLSTEPALSRDGKLLAFASDRGEDGELRIWKQPFPNGDAHPLTAGPGDEREPAFSPDGRWLAYRGERDGGNVYRIAVNGGSPELLAAGGRRPRYSPDGKWLAFFTGEESPHYPNRLFIMPGSGGAPTLVSRGFESAAAQVWSPDSRRLLFLGRRPADDRPAWWLASLDHRSIEPLHVPESLQLNRFHLNAFRMIADDWTPDGRLLFTYHRGFTTVLGEAGISGNSVTGPVRALAENGTLNVRASAAPDGRIVYASVRQNLNLWMHSAQSRVLSAVTVDDSEVVSPSVSPDGSLLVMNSRNARGVSILLRSFDTGTDSPLLRDQKSGSWGKLIASGTRLAYFLESRKEGDVWTRSVATGEAERLTHVPEQPWDVSQDGRHVLFPSAQEPRALIRTGVDGTTPFLSLPGVDVSDARFSPDGAWVSYVAGERIFVSPFPAGGPGTAASATPGAYAEWDPDGRSLYFLSKADGFVCLWNQPLDPLRKTASGPARAVRHFHQYTLSPRNASRRQLRLAVSRRGVIIPLGRQTGQIFVSP